MRVVVAPIQGGCHLGRRVLLLNRDEAELLFTRYLSNEPRAAAHSRAVCEAAELLATRLREAGMAVQPEVAGTLGLLHDIGRSRTHDGVLHCVEGWSILSPIDEATARICLYHFLKGRSVACMVELVCERGAQPSCELRGLQESGLYPPSHEEEVACFADSLAAGAELVTIGARFEDLQARSATGAKLFSHSMDWACRYLESLRTVYGVDAYECLGVKR